MQMRVRGQRQSQDHGVSKSMLVLLPLCLCIDYCMIQDLMVLQCQAPCRILIFFSVSVFIYLHFDAILHMGHPKILGFSDFHLLRDMSC